MILLIIVITLLANLADVLLKLGARDAGDAIGDPLVLLTIPWVWLGAVSGITAMALWIYVLGRHHLSHAYPVFVGLSFLNITIAAVVFFDEEIGLLRLLGIGLILAGIFVVHFNSREKKTPPAIGMVETNGNAAPAAPPGAVPSEAPSS